MIFLSLCSSWEAGRHGNVTAARSRNQTALQLSDISVFGHVKRELLGLRAHSRSHNTQRLLLEPVKVVCFIYLFHH